MTTIEFVASAAGAAESYDTLGDAYDVLTAGYCHEVWLGRIEQFALEHGLRGRRLLDIACGTGKSFLALAERGYQVTACDISPAMVEIARAKALGAAITVGDMRELEQLGEFDLITCLDDAVNYLLEPHELDSFFSGVARNLSANGLFVFDLNTLKAYREGFVLDRVVDDPAAFIAWTARDADQTSPGDRVTATVDVFSPDGSRWTRRTSRHYQRHWPQAVIAGAAAAAGLKIVALRGQYPGAVLDEHFDELEHNKALYLTSHAERAVSAMRIWGP
jgi:SAM-dependent methyltransferase